MSAFWHRLRRSAGDDPAQNPAEMEEEMRFHLEMAVQRYIQAGLDAAEAKRRAIADFGGVRQQQESAADERRSAWWDVLRQDVRFGLRTLRRNIGFTAAVSTTMALGVAGAAAMFSVVYAVMVRPLPVRHPEQLVYIGWDFGGGKINSNLSPYQFDFVRRNARGIAGATTVRGANVDMTRGESTEPALAYSVTEGFFTVFARQPTVGRMFSSDEWQTRDSHVAIISHSLWKRAFAGEEQVLSRTIRLNAIDYRIVGVMPEGSDIPGAIPAPDVLLPLQFVADVRETTSDAVEPVDIVPATGKTAREVRARRWPCPAVPPVRLR